MKKLSIIFMAIGIASVLTTMALPPKKSNSKNFIAPRVITVLPDSIHSIVKHSCFACHGAGGKKSALMMLNFEKWDSYAPKKQADKANEMAKKIKDGSMPPASYLKKNPNSAPTKSQINTVNNWAKSFKK